MPDLDVDDGSGADRAAVLGELALGLGQLAVPALDRFHLGGHLVLRARRQVAAHHPDLPAVCRIGLHRSRIKARATTALWRQGYERLPPGTKPETVAAPKS